MNEPFPACITTCPRSHAYLARTWRSIRAAGWSNPTIFNDADKSLGAVWNMARAVRTMADRAVKDCLTVGGIVAFQDDIEVATGMLDWLVDNLWPADQSTIGVVSLYTGLQNAQDVEGWSKVCPLPNAAHGALAFVFPRHVIDLFFPPEVLDGPLYRDDGRRPIPADIYVGMLCEKYGLDWWTHSPSFVRHLGEVSSIDSHSGADGIRQAKEWLTTCSQPAISSSR